MTWVEATWVEVSRRAVDEAGECPCLGCGKTIRLYFNGGELDQRTCCGYRYSLEHVRIDFVIEKREASA